MSPVEPPTPIGPSGAAAWERDKSQRAALIHASADPRAGERERTMVGVVNAFASTGAKAGRDVKPGREARLPPREEEDLFAPGRDSGDVDGALRREEVEMAADASCSGTEKDQTRLATSLEPGRTSRKFISYSLV